MKKRSLIVLLFILTSSYYSVSAHSCSSHAYLTHKDFYQEEQTFSNCKQHYVLKETSVYYYSNGTRRSYTNSTIYNEDGSVLESDCRNVRHIIYNNKHYFTFYKNKKYNIMNNKGEIISLKNYKSMEEVKPNRLLVKLNKKYVLTETHLTD